MSFLVALLISLCSSAGPNIWNYWMIHTSSINRGACEASVTVSSQIWLIGNLHCILPAPCESTKSGYGGHEQRRGAEIKTQMSTSGESWTALDATLGSPPSKTENTFQPPSFSFYWQCCVQKLSECLSQVKATEELQISHSRGLFTDCLFLKCLCVIISFFDPSPFPRFSLRVPFQVKLDYTFVIKHWHADRVMGYSLSRFLVNNHFFNSICSKEQKVLKCGRKMEANKKIMECRWKHKMCWTPQ